MISNKIRNTILTSVFTCTSLLSSFAVPAYKGVIDYTLPDGTSVKVSLKGDEFVHWAESPDGYTLLKDSDDYWVFAQQSQSGDIEVSNIRYMGDTKEASNYGIAKGLKFSKKQIAKIKGMKAAADNSIKVDGSFPSSGKCKLLMLLINYADTKVTYSQQDFEDFMNKHNYCGVGSFRDFYLEQSGGKLDIQTTVTPWVNLKFDKQIYGAEGAINMIVDALGYLGDNINLRDFDNDNDGILDGLAVIHQGKGQEMTGNGYDIWSHSSMIYGYSFNGITLRRYTIQPEMLSTGKMSTIGVICHEFGHNLGAPDFYDTDYESSGGYYPGTGVWDVMGAGMWNGDYGDHPAGMNIWERSLLGWADVVELNETTDVKDIQSSEIDPKAYKMATTTPGEYFIMENRQRTSKFNSVLPGSGLLIYHINEQMVNERIESNTLNVEYPQTAFLVCAGAHIDPNEFASSYGKVNEAECPFPGSENITDFNDRTLPSTKSIKGRQSYVALENIQEKDSLISFRFIKEETPPSPINLQAKVYKGEVTLTWDLEEGKSEVPAYFSIYRNGVLIANTTKYTYVDTPKIEGLLMTYTVDAEYTDGRISLLANTQICVPANKIENLNLESSNGYMKLSWTLNPVITRNPSLTETLSIGFDIQELDYAQRFTSDDLLTYKLSKITKVAILPYMSPTEVALSVKVWEADKSGENPKVVSEQEVKEFGTATWREVILSTPVTIKANKEYWIGAHCISSTQSIQMATDKGPKLEGRGNLVCVDGEWVECDDVQGNFLVYAVTTPNAPAFSTSMPSFPEVNDAKYDLLYPIGFNIYCDGTLIGTSGNCYFLDKNATEGKHTYTVSCVYKGNNESTGLDALTVDTGIKDKTCYEFSAIGVNGGILLRNVTTPINIYNLQGEKVAYACESGLVSMSKGIYVVKDATHHANKVIVK